MPPQALVRISTSIPSAADARKRDQCRGVALREVETTIHCDDGHAVQGTTRNGRAAVAAANPVSRQTQFRSIGPVRSPEQAAAQHDADVRAWAIAREWLPPRTRPAEF